MRLDDRLREHVDRRPDDAAVFLQRAGQPDLAITYAELWSGAARYARTYRARRVAAGNAAILILQHGVDLVYGFWGAVIAGVIPSIMPFLTEKLSPEQYRNDLKALIGVTRPRAVVTYPEFEAQVREAIGGASDVDILLSSETTQEGPWQPPGSSGSSLASPEDIVLLQHSSGTTGLQKGVALTHQAVLNQLAAYGGALGLREDDVVVSWLPLYHDMGLIAGFLMPILSGIPLVLSSPFDWVRAPWRLLRSVSHYRGTLTWLPNFAYNFMSQKVRDRDVESMDLSSWRAVINCSEPVHWESHRAFYQRFQGLGLKWNALQTCYAMAENVFGVTQSDVEGEPAIEDLDRAAFMEERVARPARGNQPAIRMMSSGRPISNTQIRILDDRGAALPDRTIGEVALQSNCMLAGYYHRPDADKAAFHDGWYLTGDYGYLSRGELYVAGRKKDLIIIGGKNVYPQDLEALSYEVPGIHAGRSVAFGVFNEETGTEDVYMVAETDSENQSRQNELAELLRQHVTKNSAVALRHVRVVGPKWILKTSSGKTARAANRDKLLREIASTDM